MRCLQPHLMYRKICVKRPLSKRPKIGFQDQLLINAGQKDRRMYSAIRSTFIKLPLATKIFVLSIFEWPLYTGFTAHDMKHVHVCTDLIYHAYVLLLYQHNRAPTYILSSLTFNNSKSKQHMDGSNPPASIDPIYTEPD